MNMIDNAIEVSTFANDFKFQSRTYLIEECGTYLYRSKVKTASPSLPLLYFTCLTFDEIRLYQCLALLL